MVLQNSISTNDFSHSVQGWSFSPVCISKCLPKVPAMLNDFLHSVVQLCGFSPLSMNMCFFNFPVCVNDFLHCAQMWGFPQYEKAYESLLSSSTSNLSLALKVSQSTLTSPYCNQSLALKNCNPTLASPASNLLMPPSCSQTGLKAEHFSVASTSSRP